MDQRVKVKSDASYNEDVGIGMGYVCETDEHKFNGRGYIDKKCSSTEAEMLSTAWSIHDATKKIDINPSEYCLVVETDCKPTVNKYDNGYESDSMRFIDYYSKAYDKMMMFWIPRETNQKADKIAKLMLRKAKDD